MGVNYITHSEVPNTALNTARVALAKLKRTAYGKGDNAKRTETSCGMQASGGTPPNSGLRIVIMEILKIPSLYQESVFLIALQRNKARGRKAMLPLGVGLTLIRHAARLHGNATTLPGTMTS